MEWTLTDNLLYLFQLHRFQLLQVWVILEAASLPTVRFREIFIRKGPGICIRKLSEICIRNVSEIYIRKVSVQTLDGQIRGQGPQGYESVEV